MSYETHPIPTPGTGLKDGRIQFSDGVYGLFLTSRSCEVAANALDGLSVINDFEGKKTEILGILLTLLKGQIAPPTLEDQDYQPEEEEPRCVHCGKPIYDCGEIGCRFCDARHPDFNL